MKNHVQIHLTPAQLRQTEQALLEQGYRASTAATDLELRPMEYRKRPHRVDVDGLFTGSWWTISWRPDSRRKNDDTDTCAKTHQQNKHRG